MTVCLANENQIISWAALCNCDSGSYIKANHELRCNVWLVEGAYAGCPPPPGHKELEEWEKLFGKANETLPKMVQTHEQTSEIAMLKRKIKELENESSGTLRT